MTLTELYNAWQRAKQLGKAGKELTKRAIKTKNACDNITIVGKIISTNAKIVP